MLSDVDCGLCWKITDLRVSFNGVDTLDDEVIDIALKAEFFIVMRVEGFEDGIIPLITQKKNDHRTMKDNRVELQTEWLRDLKRFVAEYRVAISKPSEELN